MSIISHNPIYNKVFSSINTLWLILVLFFISGFIQLSYAAESVGAISFSRGTAAAYREGEDPRILGLDVDVFEGDNIQTSDRSFVIVTFNDDTKITIRPNSSFTINQFSSTGDNQTAKLSLHKGGILTSGTDNQKNVNDFQIITPTTTVKAQQADFSVRVCSDECQLEDNKLKRNTLKSKKDIIARIVEIRGLVTATNTKQSKIERPLSLGAPLYSSDIILSEEDGYAVLVFNDKGRITLEELSKFAIKEYTFNVSGKKDKALYKLITGGMRVLTGSIGKENQEDYAIETPVATIGIRGTGFDLYMQEQGLYSYVWQGTIAQTNTSGTSELSMPNTSFIASKISLPKLILQSDIPQTKKSNSGNKDTDDESSETAADESSDEESQATTKTDSKENKTDEPQKAPRPDKVKVIDESDLFVTTPLKDSPPGTYVAVHQGHVQVSNEDGSSLILGGSESSYSNGSEQNIRVEQTPKFIEQEPYPLPNESFNNNIAEIIEFSLLLSDNIELEVDTNAYQCEIK